jgi:hypothetical protein
MTRTNESPSFARAFVLVGANVINSVPQYLDRVANLIWGKNNENAGVDITGPRLSPRGNDWTVAVFGAKVRFGGGEILEITDNFSRESPWHEGWTRKFAYFFGRTVAGEMERIFLFDTHGLYGAQGHLHIGPDERIYAGDPRLNGFSPENVDITDVCRFVDL